MTAYFFLLKKFISLFSSWKARNFFYPLSFKERAEVRMGFKIFYNQLFNPSPP